MFFKVIVSIGLFFISLACAVYSWDTYQRRSHELKAWEHCKLILDAQFEGHPEKAAEEALETAIEWNEIDKCANRRELTVNVNVDN